MQRKVQMVAAQDSHPRLCSHGRAGRRVRGKRDHRNGYGKRYAGGGGIWKQQQRDK